MPRTLHKILIANRGEIACRLIAAARSLDLQTVAVYSEVDAGARHVQLADEAIAVGPGPAAASYLNIENILAAAQSSRAEAIHPGYGFLAERADFAAAVEQAGLVWIGPHPDVIAFLGNKVAAKQAAEKAGVPTLPWARLGSDSEKPWSSGDLRAAAEHVGYPLLLKAAAGGGGRGMRLVLARGEIDDKADSAVREAQGAFGSNEVFLEAYCPAARHVEVQILGDHCGNILTLGERECSIQRRHQKVIEESPGPRLTAKSRQALWQAAVMLARAVGYRNAGTCEFLVDSQENFYFLEMNTRLQVEHPVTELIWGVDIPVMQVRIAMGESLPDELCEPERQPRGHAIEARLYAEDPAKGFIPSPGKLLLFQVPFLPGLRVDTGYETGHEIPIYYDAMMAKLIAWGADRDQARRTLLDGLRRTRIGGVAWNGPYLADVLRHPRFINGDINTHFLEEEFSSWKGPSRTEPEEPPEAAPSSDSGTLSPWIAFARDPVLRSQTGRQRSPTGSLNRPDLEPVTRDGPLIAEHPGKVLKVLVGNGDSVQEGQVLVVCESMKMEFSYAAPFAGRIREVKVREGQVIPGGTPLLEWEEAP